MRGLHATRRRVVFGMAVGLVTFAASASSEPILDQQAVREDPVTGFAVIPQQSISQTFTAGLSGLLESIEVSLYRNADAVGDVFVSLLRTPLDPTSAVFSTSIPHASIPVDRGSFVHLPVAAAGVVVNPGDVWAIQLSRSSGGGSPPWVIWNFALPYEGGTGYSSIAGATLRDVAFRTFIETDGAPVPEPGSLVLLGIALAAAAKARRGRRCGSTNIWSS